MQPNRRTFVKVVLVRLYFALWYSFGAMYRSIADSSAGTEFIFQEDLRIGSQVSQVRTQVGLPLDDHTLKGVLRAMTGANQGFLPSFPDKDVPLVLHNPLGEAWGKYYLDWAQKQGYSHFRLDASENPSPQRHHKVTVALYRRGVTLEEGARGLPYHRMWVVDNEDPRKTHIYLLPTAEQAKTWTPARELVIWTKVDPATLDIDDWTREYPSEVRASGVQPVVFLDSLMSAAVNDPDGSVHTVQQVLRGRFKYSLVDFLYFSAVTITTVGYGDILPNSTRVRSLVMAEALLGIVCIGAFVSSLFGGDGRRTRRDQP